MIIENLFYFQHLTERVAMYVHAYTLYSSLRPYGASMLMGSYDDDTPQLYMVEPSGVFYVRTTYIKSHSFIFIFLLGNIVCSADGTNHIAFFAIKYDSVIFVGIRM